MRIVTFNVNGIRSLKEDYSTTKKWSFDQLLDSFNADIICFQESKVNKPEYVDHDIAFPRSYTAYFGFPRIPKKIGYSGVVTYVKNSCKHPVRSFYDGFTRDIDIYDDELLDLLDSEGRVMATDHGSFYLFNVYFPNDSGNERSFFRERFYSALYLRCKDLVVSGRTVLIAGDLNTTYDLIDHCDYVKPYLELEDLDLVKQSIERFTLELVSPYIKADGTLLMESLHSIPLSFDISKMRNDYPELIQEYFQTKPSRLWARYMFNKSRTLMIDCFRLFHRDEPNRFTCWNTLLGARGSNYGTRLDYIIAMGNEISKDPSVFVKASDGMFDFMGSDHCPMWAEFEFKDIPWTDHAEVKLSVPVHAQRRLDAFFKPVSKEKPAEKTAASISSTEEPPVKKMKTLQDTRLPFAKPKEQDPLPSCPMHGEPGKLLTVNKSGPNKGRKFYTCSRPMGHATDREARCNFFKWADGRR